MKSLAALAVAASAFASDPAHAHDLATSIGGFSGGVLHPFVVPAHVMLLLALGIEIGQQPCRRILLLVAFAVGLIIGIIAIVGAVVAYNAENYVLGAAAISGTLAVIARPLPLIVNAAFALVAGAAVELDSVPQDISMLRTLLALGGTAISASLAVSLAAGIATTRRRDWERIGLRVLGSWIAAGAVLVLVLRLAR